ncbi:MAG: alpha-N-arabinofuranosidase [Opitutaceae bacterium]|nr:alpha-N-arabinofuranosidase [Opitutaceae bacterium]
MKAYQRILLVTLFPLVVGAAQIEVALDRKKQGAPINPMIYGQFIEHLGRCIYGGIWAEMLEDRKFYFEVTPEYAPYTSLQDSDFPVVGASPWEIFGDAAGLTMLAKDSFVGDHTPRLSAGTGIRQHDLSWQKGREYEGYVWLKRAGDKLTKVSLRLGGVDQPAVFELVATEADYQQFHFKWQATADTAKGTVDIEVTAGSALVGTASIMPADNVRGMRADTVALLQELDASIYRWPGGNFVSGYDWRDGVGDRDRRPPRVNPAWQGVEHNDFGTDEFIDFCRTVGADPVVTANMGFGDAYSAAQWVEYCNAGADTVGGNMRVENGTPEPFDVWLWCVGNEMWGTWQLGYMHLDQYTLKHNRAARAMWEVDPELTLVGSGDLRSRSKSLNSDRERGWSEGMLQDSAPYMTHLSEHFYAGRIPWEPERGRVPVAEHVTQVAEFIKLVTDGHREMQPEIDALGGRIVPIAMTEWNYWHREYVYGELGCIYEMQDALGIAAGLHEYYRQSDIVQMAYYAQTVNVIGAIKTTDTAAEFESTGLVLKLYRAHYGDTPLLLEQDFGALDVAAALDENGTVLTLAVMNPLDETVTVELAPAGVVLGPTAQRFWVGGNTPEAFNTPGQPRRVNEFADQVSLSDGLQVPALSATIFRIPLK